MAAALPWPVLPRVLPDCVLPWLAAHRACPAGCYRAVVPLPLEDPFEIFIKFEGFVRNLSENGLDCGLI